MTCLELRIPVVAGVWQKRFPLSHVHPFFSAVIAAALCSTAMRAQSPQQQYVYSSGGASVSGFAKDSTTGALTATPNSPYSERIGGRSLAIDPLGRFLYVLNPAANNVSVFAIDRSTGALTEVAGSPFSAGDAASPQVLAAEASGKFLYVGNLQGNPPGFTTVGILDAYSVDANTGVLLPVSNLMGGPFNPTAMVSDAKGRFLYTNAGFNSQTGDPGFPVAGYGIDPVTGGLTSLNSACGNGVQGRSLAIDPKERYLFAGHGQFGSFIDSCAISPVDGTLQSLGMFTISLQGSYPVALAVDSSGSYLYAVISVGVLTGFSVDPSSGTLTRLPDAFFPNTLMGLGLVADPQGPFLYGIGGNGLVGFQIDPSTGALTQIATVSAPPAQGFSGIAISGTQVQPASGPVATPVPTSVDAGSVTVGATSGTFIVRIVNTGDQALGFSGISITGQNSADFGQTNTCTVPLAPNQNCAISVTFTPSAAGTRTATLSIGDSAPASPQMVPLTGIGVAQQAAVTLTPGSLTFSNTLVSTTSNAQRVAVSNSGQAALIISSISISGPNPPDFSQTNDCANATLQPSGNCALQVKFQPLAAGQRSATINISDNAPGTPHSVSLSGMGNAPFNVAPSGNNPTTATVSAGQTAQYLLQLTPTAGFTGTVTMTCTGAPRDSTCQVSPGSIPVNNTNPVPLTVSVATTARGYAVPDSGKRRLPPFRAPWGPMFVVALIVLLLLRRRHLEDGDVVERMTWCRVSAALALLVLVGTAGCGGVTAGNNIQPPPQSGTPAGTSTIIVTASSGNVTEQIQLTLTVK